MLGMKDASNLIMVDKATGLPTMYINYANATTSEWTSEAVFATNKGVNQIRWDSARTGTLTLDTELFDMSLLSLAMGSAIKDGSTEVMKRVDATLDDSLSIAIDSNIVDESSISVVKTVSESNAEHVGLPLFNNSSAILNLPAQIQSVSVTVNDSSATINFPVVQNASGYEISRDGETIADVEANQYIDDGLTPDTEYVYSVSAYNSYGSGAESAVVTVTTSAEGVNETNTVVATAQARVEAASNEGSVLTPNAGEITYTYTNGTIQFENAVAGDTYAIYFLEEVVTARTITVESEVFSSSYEIFAEAAVRDSETNRDTMIQIHYYNARPQPNFTLTQSATEPTALSIIFDLMPANGILADFIFMQ